MAPNPIPYTAVAVAVASRYVLGNTSKPTSLLIQSLLYSTAIWCFWWCILYPFLFSPFRHLPSPKQEFVLKRFLKEPLAETTEGYLNDVPNKGLIRYFGAFNQERIMATTPDAVKQVMQTQGYHYGKTGFAAKVLGRIIPYGLLTCNDPEQHKFQRRVLNKAFKYANIRELYPVFWAQTVRLLGAMEKDMKAEGQDVNTKAVNIWNWMTRATLDTIALATFGGQWNALDNADAPLAKSWDIIVGSDRASTPYRMLALILPGWLWTRLPMKARHRFDAAKSVVMDQTKSLIDERKMNISKGKTGLEGPKVDILSEILKSGHPKTDDKLMGQALTFLAAGHDTTANGLTFVLYLLSKHPEIQDKVRQEIHSKIPSPKTTENDIEINARGSPAPTFDPATSLETLTYLAAVINEGLRLYAPIPHQRRVVKYTPTTLLNTDLPMGATIVVNPYSMNRAKPIWGADATEFKPERWIDNETGKIDPTGGTGNIFAVATFGHGPRQCIGEKFARAEMVAMLAGFIGRYEFSYKGAGEKGDEELQVVFPLVTKPVGGVWLECKKTEGW